MLSDKINVSSILYKVRSGNYTVDEILHECSVSRKTFHMILLNAGYPIPSNSLRITSAAYRQKIQTISLQQKNLWDADSATVSALREKVEKAQKKFRRDLLANMIASNKEEAKALAKLKKEN